jgi:hypothetical protein
MADAPATTTAVTTPDGSATVATTVKPGYATTEFWLSLIANLVGALMASGMFADGSTVMRVAGVAAMVLATLGYQAARAWVKS